MAFGMALRPGTANRLPPCTCHTLLLPLDRQVVCRRYHRPRTTSSDLGARGRTPETLNGEGELDPPLCPPLGAPTHAVHANGAPPEGSLAALAEPPFPDKSFRLVPPDVNSPSKSPNRSRAGSKDSNLSRISDKGAAVDLASSIENDAGSRLGSKASGANWLQPDKVVQRGRRTSKTLWKRSVTREQTMEMVESPDFMWEKYLKHCTAEQLNWLSDEFDNNQKDQYGGIPVDQAARIVEDWIVLTHDCENPKPEPNVVEECRSLVLGSSGNSLKYEQLVSFLSQCEMMVLQSDAKAGYSEEEVLRFKSAFLEHAQKRGFNNTSRLSLSTLDTFNVLTTLGRDTSSPETQKNVVEVVKEVDCDKSGDLDFEEYLHLVRKVQISDSLIARHQEHVLIHRSSFSDEEIEGFQELWMYWAGPENTFKLPQLLNLLESLLESDPLDAQKKRELIAIIRQEAGEKYNNGTEESESISLGVFLMVLRRLFDADFASIRTSVEKILKMRAEEELHTPPEEWQTRRRKSVEDDIREQKSGSSWIRRMIDKKQDTKVKRASLMESMTGPKVEFEKSRTNSSTRTRSSIG